MSARRTDLETSHEAATLIRHKRATIDKRIIQLARAAGASGITQSEVVACMSEYKPGSITPRFIRLVKRGDLVRLCLGSRKVTEKFPQGVSCFRTRRDEETGRKVTVYWVPEFAPVPANTECQRDVEGTA